MTPYEVAEKLSVLIRTERKTTNEILALINLALEKRSYLELGFASMFDWLVKGFGYSNAAAYRRIEAARLMNAVPSISNKLENGNLNLSTVSRANSAIRAQEKATGLKVSLELKTKIVEQIQKLSQQDAELKLMAAFPEAKLEVQRERRTVIDAHTVRHAMNLSTAATADLQRAREVLSHSMPGATDAEILTHALKFLLDRIDPLRKTTSAAEASRVTKIGQRRGVLRSADGRCTFKNAVTGQLCGSRYQIEIDHIVAKGIGGGDAPTNLRTLCRKHNVHVAEKVYGKRVMEHYRMR